MSKTTFKHGDLVRENRQGSEIGYVIEVIGNMLQTSVGDLHTSKAVKVTRPQLIQEYVALRLESFRKGDTDRVLLATLRNREYLLTQDEFEAALDQFNAATTGK